MAKTSEGGHTFMLAVFDEVGHLRRGETNVRAAVVFPSLPRRVPGASRWCGPFSERHCSAKRRTTRGKYARREGKGETGAEALVKGEL